MNRIAASPYRKWIILGLIVQIITAWYSVGYNHPDEHFQILEYCNYKMGHSGVHDLPWEFAKQCRPGLQPFIAYCLFKPLEAASVYDPFIAAFLLRLLTGILTWWVTCKLIFLLLPNFTTQKGRDVYVGSSFFLWFVSYMGVRFSAENVAGVIFFLALSILLKIDRTKPGHKYLNLSISGLLLGFSIFIRPQMAFAFVGLAIWMLMHRWKLKYWIILGVFMATATGISVLVDHWLYGVWVFTPFNYYYVNIVLHKAANFGVSPWYHYLTDFVQIAGPPVSIALLFLFFLGLFKKPLHLFSLVIITFLLGHFVIAHKEMRFLFPVITPFIFLCCIGADSLVKMYEEKRAIRWTFAIMVTANFILLAVKMFTPAQEMVKYYRYIYNEHRNNNTTLISFEKSPYYAYGLEENFYKPHNLDLRIVAPGSFQAFLDSANKPVLFFSETQKLAPVLANCKPEIVYCYFPKLLLRYNISDWQSRSRIWTIYKIYPPARLSQ